MRTLHKIALLALLAATPLPGAAQDAPDKGALPQPSGDWVPRPIMETHTVPDYPALSVQLHEEGTTVMTVRISSRGVAEDCSIFQSSSSERLDQAACDHIKSTWRWEPPAKDVTRRISVQWDLDDIPKGDPIRPIAQTHTMPAYPPLALQNKEQGMTRMMLHITVEGVTDGCEILEGSGSELLDQAACDHIKSNWRWEKPTRQGKPSPGFLQTVLIWHAGTGKVWEPDYSTAGALIHCASQDKDTRWQKCDAPFGSLYVLTLLDTVTRDPGKWCGMAPSQDPKQNIGEFRDKVLGWIRDHPETHRQLLSKTARDAVKQLYPCKQ